MMKRELADYLERMAVNGRKLEDCLQRIEDWLEGITCDPTYEPYCATQLGFCKDIAEDIKQRTFAATMSQAREDAALEMIRKGSFDPVR